MPAFFPFVLSLVVLATALGCARSLLTYDPASGRQLRMVQAAGKAAGVFFARTRRPLLSVVGLVVLSLSLSLAMTGSALSQAGGWLLAGVIAGTLAAIGLARIGSSALLRAALSASSSAASAPRRLTLGGKIGAGLLLAAEAFALLLALGAHQVPAEASAHLLPAPWLLLGATFGALTTALLLHLRGAAFVCTTQAGYEASSAGERSPPEAGEDATLDPTLLVRLAAPAVAGVAARLVEVLATSLLLYTLSTLALGAQEVRHLLWGLPLVLRAASLLGSGILLQGVALGGSSSALVTARVAALADALLSLLAAAGSTRLLVGATGWFPAWCAVGLGVIAQLALTTVVLAAPAGQGLGGAGAPTLSDAALRARELGGSFAVLLLAAGLAGYLAASSSLPLALTFALLAVGLFASNPIALSGELSAQLMAIVRPLLSADDNHRFAAAGGGELALARLGRTRHGWLALALAFVISSLASHGGFDLLSVNYAGALVLAAGVVFLAFWWASCLARLTHHRMTTRRRLEDHLSHTSSPSAADETFTAPGGSASFRPQYMYYVHHAANAMPIASVSLTAIAISVPVVFVGLLVWLAPLQASSLLPSIGLTGAMCAVGAALLATTHPLGSTPRRGDSPRAAATPSDIFSPSALALLAKSIVAAGALFLMLRP